MTNFENDEDKAMDNHDHALDDFDISLLPKGVSVDGINNLIERSEKTGIISWFDIKDQFDVDETDDTDEDVGKQIIGILKHKGFIVENIPGEMSIKDALKTTASFQMESGQESIKSYMSAISRIPVISDDNVMLETMRRISEAYQEVSTFALTIPMVDYEICNLVKSLNGKITAYAKVIDAVGTLDLKKTADKAEAETIRKNQTEEDELLLDSDDEEEEDSEENSGGPYNSEANKYAAEVLDAAFLKWDKVFSKLRNNRLGEPSLTKPMWNYIHELSSLTGLVRLEHNLIIRLTDKVLETYKELKRIDNKIVVPAGKKNRDNIELAREILRTRKNTKRDKELQELAGLTNKQFSEIMDKYKEMAQLVKCDLVTFREQAEKLRPLQSTWIDIRNYMMASNLRLVVSLVNKQFTNRGLETSDAIQEGNIGMFKAIDKFDYKKGNKFSTYAVAWISRQIKKATMEKSNTIRVPSHMCEANYKVRNAAVEYVAKHGKSPSYEELAKITGVPVARVQAVIKHGRTQVSIDTPVSNNGDDSGATTIGDFISDRSTPSALTVVHRKMQEERIDEALSMLDERTELVIRMRIGIGMDAMTLEDIGKEFNVTRERIRQIEAKGLKMLSRPMRGRILKAYHHDDIDDEDNESS